MPNKKPMKTKLLARACLREVSASEASKISIPKKVAASESGEIDSQFDLLKMTSILVSTGMNLNDDVFLAEEVLPARDTGAHKPVNIEHDETRIIGHMLETFVTDKDGSRVEDSDIDQALGSEEDGMPQDFDITNEAVIYSFILPEIAEDIKEKALAGELFVSVEAWFTDFDFLVGNKVVARNKDTAPILDPILRANGGKGDFQGQRVGRVLRDILFGGIGVVANPANPESVVLSVGNTDSAKLVQCNVEYIDEVLAQHVVASLGSSTSTHKEEDNMSGEGEKVTKEDILEEVEAIKAANSEDTKVTEAKDSKLPETSDNSKLDELLEENKALSERISYFEVQELKQKRSDSLKEVGLTEDQVKARITKCAAMKDEEFTAYLEDIKEFVVANASEDKDSKAEASEDSKDDSSEEDSKEDKSEASSDEEDSGIELDLGDISQTDPNIPVKSNSSAVIGEGDLVKQFENVINPLLVSRNSKTFKNLNKNK